MTPPAPDDALARALADLDAEFGITSSLIGGGCEHGFKPAGDCPNESCSQRKAAAAWDHLGQQAAVPRVITKDMRERGAKALGTSYLPKYERLNYAGMVYCAMLDIPYQCQTHDAAPRAGGVSGEVVARTQAFIEGECEGLALNAALVRRLFAYAFGDDAAAEPRAGGEET